MLRPRYPIETPRLLLRPFTENDADALHAFRSLPEVVRYLYIDVQSRDEIREQIAARMQMVELAAEGDRLSLAVERRDSGRVVGDATLIWVSEQHRHGEIGYLLHPDHHGCGFAGEAATALLKLGFEGLGLHRIVGRCDGRNAASAKVMERLSMRREALLVENELVKGEWTDELVYAMLDREWTAIAAGR